METDNGVIIKRDIYITLSDSEKLIALYDTIMSMKGDLHGHCKRLKVLEKKKLRDTTYAFGGGIIGGIVAMFSRWITGN